MIFPPEILDIIIDYSMSGIRYTSAENISSVSVRFRKCFRKHFYSSIGMFEDKIRFNGRKTKFKI